MKDQQIKRLLQAMLVVVDEKTLQEQPEGALRVKLSAIALMAENTILAIEAGVEVGVTLGSGDCPEAG
jgi:hypothetical protein